MLKNILLFSFLFGIAITSCTNVDKAVKNEDPKLNHNCDTCSIDDIRKAPCNECTQKEIDVLIAATDGKVEPVKSYLDAGGNPWLKCWNYSIPNRPSMDSRLYLYYQVYESNSIPLLKCYLNYEVPTAIINEILRLSTIDRQNEYMQVLVDKGGNIDEEFACCHYCFDDLMNLVACNYDLNRVNPKKDRTLLMGFTGCTSNVTEIIEMIDYLVEKGARLDVRNKKGENAIDLAGTEQMKAYLDTNCAPCSEKEQEVLTAALNGQVAPVKAYLENGGHPALKCKSFVKGNLSTIPSTEHLYVKIMRSRSFPMLKCYLDYDVPQLILNDLLLHFIYIGGYDDYPEFRQLLVDKGGNINYLGESCRIFSIPEIYQLSRYNYDFNRVNPENGNTLLMEFAACPLIVGEEEVIEIINFLISEGARTDIKNKEGKTALDLAKNEIIKEFLIGLEK